MNTCGRSRLSMITCTLSSTSSRSAPQPGFTRTARFCPASASWACVLQYLLQLPNYGFISRPTYMNVDASSWDTFWATVTTSGNAVGITVGKAFAPWVKENENIFQLDLVTGNKELIKKDDPRM